MVSPMWTTKGRVKQIGTYEEQNERLSKLFFNREI
jgi:hypothetical protein